MALTIGTGFVVDDAIVMIENIVRHIEDGEAPFEAALDGAREIGFTVISLTVSLIAVFIPLLFMTGLVGRMFREFALTLTIAVVVSAIVSLTLTPMMCSPPAAAATRRAPSRGMPAAAASAPVEWIGRSVYRPHARMGAAPPSRLTLLLTRCHPGRHRLALHRHARRASCRCRTPACSTRSSRRGPEVSFAEMKRAAGSASSRDPATDPDVTGVVSVDRRRRRSTPPPNAGAPHDHAEARATSASRRSTTIIERLQAGPCRVPGVDVYLPAGAGHPDLNPHQPRAVPVHPHRHRRRGRRRLWSQARWPSAAHVAARCATSPSRAQEDGLRADRRRSTARRPAGSASPCRPSTTPLNDAFGQRQISTIYAQANQYRVILEAPKPQYQRATRCSMSDLVSTSISRRARHPFNRSERRRPGAAERAFAHCRARGTAPLSIAHQEQFRRVTISFNLAPSARSAPPVAGDLARPSATSACRPRVTGGYSGDAGGVRKSARGRALADPGRRRHHLSSCWACSTRASSTPSRSCPRCRRPASAPCWR